MTTVYIALAATLVIMIVAIWLGVKWCGFDKIPVKTDE